MISVHLQGKPFNTTIIQVYAPTSNAEEAEVERFYEDLQDLLEITPKKDVLFIIGDWLSMGFSRQEYWTEWPCPSPGDLPNPGIKPSSPALQADSLPSAPSGKPKVIISPPPKVLTPCLRVLLLYYWDPDFSMSKLLCIPFLLGFHLLSNLKYNLTCGCRSFQSAP